VRIVVAPEARDELAAAVGYIAKDNPAAARFVERIREVVLLLAEGGLDGPRSKLRLGAEVRSWPVPPFRIYYRREADKLHVLRIYHQSRRPL